MKDLIDFAGRNDVRRFISRVLSEAPSEGFQGVWVSRHEDWETLLAHLKSDTLGSAVRRLRQDSSWTIDDYLWWTRRTDATPSYPTDGIDWVTHWKTYCERFENGVFRDPFVIIFRLKPGALADSKVRQILQSALQNSPFFTAVEERPLPRLFGATTASSASATKLEGGILILTSAGKQGTLGGFLEDASTGRKLGLTCAHVASTGDTIAMWDDSSSTWIDIGSCIASTKMKLHSACGARCYTNKSAIDVDCALIELDNNFEGTPNVAGLGALTEIIRPENIPQDLYVSGGKSGVVKVEATKFGIWNEIAISRTECQCFKDLFELGSPGGSYMPVKLSLLFSKSVQHKDSGSFVMADNAIGGYGLCGHVIGGDGIAGFATLASNMQSWASTAGFSLKSL